MKIKAVTPQALKKVDDQEILSLHLRTHQLYGANFGPDAPPERGYKDDEGDIAVDGLQLPESAALSVWKGEVKTLRFDKRPGNVVRGMFLVSPKFAYGIIRLGLAPKDKPLEYPVEYFRAFKVPLTYKATGSDTIIQQVKITSDEVLSLETLVHAHKFIADEMKERKLKHGQVSELDTEKSPGEVEKSVGHDAGLVMIEDRENIYESAAGDLWEQEAEQQEEGAQDAAETTAEEDKEEAANVEAEQDD